MAKPLRILVRSFVVLLAIISIAAVTIYAMSESRLRRTYPVTATVGAPNPALIARGRELAQSRGCADCHGADFTGKVVIDEMPFARVVGDGLLAREDETPAQLHERVYRALHHGVDVNGKPLMMMPSAEFNSLSTSEIEAIAAYLASLPPKSKPLPQSQLGPLGRTLLVAGKLGDFISAEHIDHARAPIDAPPPIGTVEYGRHAAQLCSGCHHPDLGGGPMSHGGPSAPPSANLTLSDTGLGAWSEADFVTAMRTGKRPDGSALDGRFMPWRAVGQATDAELHSIWLYLQSVPKIDRDVRAMKNVR